MKALDCSCSLDEANEDKRRLIAFWGREEGQRWPSHSNVRAQGTLTRLRRDTAREIQVLKSSGFFLQRQVIRLTAAVTTPCREHRHEGQDGDGQTQVGARSVQG